MSQYTAPNLTISAANGTTYAYRRFLSFINLAFSPGRSRCPENSARGCGLPAGTGRCRSVARWAVWAVLVFVGGRGWEHGCGLPVTPSARGIASPEV